MKRQWKRGGLASKAAAAAALAVSLLALSVPAGAASHSSGTAISGVKAGGTINVGLVTILTGPYAAIGTVMLNDTVVGANLINAAGGVYGHKLHIIGVDGPDPVDTVPSVRQFLASDNPKLIVGFSALDWQDALPIVCKAKIVSFTYIGDPALDKGLCPYTYRLQPSDSTTGVAMAVAAKLHHYKRIALAFDTAQGSSGLVPYILRAAKSLGLKVVANVSIPETVTSYEAEVTQLLQAHPDAILTQTQIAITGAFWSQFRALDSSNIPLIGSDLTADPQWITAAGLNNGQNNEMVSVVQGSGGSASALATYTAAVQKSTGAGPNVQGMHFYDGLVVGALAMMEAKSVDPAKYQKYVVGITSPGKGKVVCHTFAACSKALKSGKSIEYFGASGTLQWNTHHDVAGPYVAERVLQNGNVTIMTKIPTSKINPLLGIH